jgi:hypothetical protein
MLGVELVPSSPSTAESGLGGLMGVYDCVRDIGQLQRRSSGRISV